ncbi:MAG: histidinol-phosphate transaminase [Proteobacteria bacterium]|nr:histidinol-phosphate transaminase [Pseudomonadota bacterium]MBU1233812.1 histidinol-phosphate transaminase [Pseudomonadota bacterium]MBU1420197.1 histidinol-phosphate transaminase [Pseudomonadota bacterium]MBU1455526.1 histidinol-phosphate transaminase [Pseudomonadota bacterium]
MKIQVPEYIKSIIPYPPGKPMDELEREYGVTNSIKLASNENAWGSSPKAIEAIREALTNLHRYPDGSNYYLVKAIAEKFGFSPSEVIIGNGSDEIIEFLVKAYVEKGDEVITSHPSFLMYQKVVQVRGGVNNILPLKDMRHDLATILGTITDRTRLIFLDNPNNPTATAIPPGDLYTFLSNVPESVIVVLDEAYVDFMDPEMQVDAYSLVRNSKGRCGVVILRTFSKAYGLAGIRVGYGLMAADIVSSLHRVRQPFNVNKLAQVAAIAALGDTEFYEKTLQGTREGKAWLQKEVKKLGCTTYPSQTNFFLIDVKGDAAALYEAMLYKGVIIRSMKPYGYSHVIRVTVGTDEENYRFVGALADCLSELGYVS